MKKYLVILAILAIPPTTIGGELAKQSDITVQPLTTGVKFPRTIKDETELAKATAEFDIVQKGTSITITAQAHDADGKAIAVDSSLSKGKLSEDISSAAKSKGDIKYPVTIDPIQHS